MVKEFATPASLRESRNRADTFGTFLETLQKSGRRPMISTELLGLLRDGPQPVSRIARLSGLGLLRLAEVVNGLRDADLLEVQDAEEELLVLSPIGERLLKLA